MSVIHNDSFKFIKLKFLKNDKVKLNSLSHVNHRLKCIKFALIFNVLTCSV